MVEYSCRVNSPIQQSSTDSRGKSSRVELGQVIVRSGRVNVQARGGEGLGEGERESESGKRGGERRDQWRKTERESKGERHRKGRIKV